MVDNFALAQAKFGSRKGSDNMSIDEELRVTGCSMLAFGGPLYHVFPFFWNIPAPPLLATILGLLHEECERLNRECLNIYLDIGVCVLSFILKCFTLSGCLCLV